MPKNPEHFKIDPQFICDEVLSQYVDTHSELGPEAYKYALNIFHHPSIDLAQKIDKLSSSSLIFTAQYMEQKVSLGEWVNNSWRDYIIVQKTEQRLRTSPVSKIGWILLGFGAIYSTRYIPYDY